MAYGLWSLGLDSEENQSSVIFPSRMVKTTPS